VNIRTEAAIESHFALRIVAAILQAREIKKAEVYFLFYLKNVRRTQENVGCMRLNEMDSLWMVGIRPGIAKEGDNLLLRNRRALFHWRALPVADLSLISHRERGRHRHSVEAKRSGNKRRSAFVNAGVVDC
jgi:hypothetical protein